MDIRYTQHESFGNKQNDISLSMREEFEIDTNQSKIEEIHRKVRHVSLLFLLCIVLSLTPVLFQLVSSGITQTGISILIFCLIVFYMYLFFIRFLGIERKFYLISKLRYCRLRINHEGITQTYGDGRVWSFKKEDITEIKESSNGDISIKYRQPGRHLTIPASVDRRDEILNKIATLRIIIKSAGINGRNNG